MYLLFLLIATSLATACHPECHWVCNDPICTAICEPVCDQPICEICHNTSSLICLPTNRCITQCPSDMCEVDTCPQCETVCPPLCQGAPNCTILCEETECSWLCSLPRNCQRPTCSLMCEQPACEFSSATHSYTVIWSYLLALIGIVSIM